MTCFTERAQGTDQAGTEQDSIVEHEDRKVLHAKARRVVGGKIVGGHVCCVAWHHPERGIPPRRR